MNQNGPGVDAHPGRRICGEDPQLPHPILVLAFLELKKFMEFEMVGEL